MRKLLLMRHAKAARTPALSDHARPLIERGHDDAARIASFIQAHGLAPHLAVASDSRRTKETLEIATSRFSPQPVCRLHPDLYLAEPAEILNVIRAAPASVRTLLVVGHNPGVAELALALSGSGESSDMRRLAASFPTSAVAVLDFDGPWSTAAEQGGRLERFMVPKALRPADSGGEQLL